MVAEGIAARLAAARALQAVLVERRMLADLRDAPDGPFAGLDPADRARVLSLTTGVLRELGRVDAVLNPFLDRHPPRPVMNVLRLAVHEMLSRGAPAHAVVNAAVTIVRRSRKHRHLAGLVNAVARRVDAEARPRRADLPPQPLPSWLAKPVRDAWGPEAVERIAAAHAKGAPIDLTVKNPDETDEWARRLGAELLPTGSLRLKGRGQLSALPGFAEGAWWVQDAAAALPARVLAPRPGERVLDLCAAPGGKTMQLAATGAEVTAVDLSEKRLQRLRQNLTRTGLAARVVAADALSWRPEAPAQAILLDAPCSATGTIRRHPDLPYVRAGVDLSELFRLQEQLLDHAAGLLAPGGRLVYCTCSLLPREGETQIERFLSRNPAMRAVPIDAAALGLDPAWVDSTGALRLRPDCWPGRGGMDGFYIALLERR